MKAEREQLLERVKCAEKQKLDYLKELQQFEDCDPALMEAKSSYHT
jgi:hypothetical protein